MKHILAIFLATIISCANAQGQSSENGFTHKLGLSFSELHINIPLNRRLGEKRHLGTAINFEISKRRTHRYQFGHNFNLGFFEQKDLFRALFVNYTPTFSYKLMGGLQADIPIGLGYAHSFSTSRGYVIKDGSYQASRSFGKSHFSPSIGVGASYKLKQLTAIPLEVSISYEFVLLYPYAPQASLPFTPHTKLNIGIKYIINE